MEDKKISVTDLQKWFSKPRLGKYLAYTNPGQVYLWNAQITKELLIDIGHLEVLLRNSLDAALHDETVYGELWFQNPKLPMSSQARKSIDKAIMRATKRGTREVESSRIIAELSLDFWRYLFAKYYQATIWPKFASTLHHKVSRKEFEQHLNFVYVSRNRFSHHEPLIRGSAALDIEYVQKIQASISWLASLISPESSHWITHNSRANITLQEHPAIK